MKDVLVLIGVFAAGYFLTMGFLFAMVKLFFPFKAVEKTETGTATNTVKLVRSSRHASKYPARMRRVKLANG
jgi:hypothetical protein